jgi:hypothetical protein
MAPSDGALRAAEEESGLRHRSYGADRQGNHATANAATRSPRRQGQLGRMIFGVLRDANGQPLSTAAIVTGILRPGNMARLHGLPWRRACAETLDTYIGGKRSLRLALVRPYDGCSPDRQG